MTDDNVDLAKRLRRSLSTHSDRALTGRVVAVQSGTIRARVPSARVGACYEVEREGRPLRAEVAGFDEETVILLPWEEPEGVRPDATIRETEVAGRAPRAAAVLGDVIDAAGISLIDGSTHAGDGRPLRSPPPSPLKRRPIKNRVATSIRAIDGLLALGEGQRVGLFAGSGVGKSTLLAQLARGTNADVCVVALVGERGREVGEFIEDVLDEETRARTTIVVATSDAPPMLRRRAAEMATALAEEWRDEGKHCLLLVDSLTRYARALREAALLAGEAPARRGYPASVFARIPALLERAGMGSRGAITAVYTVLVEGGDMEEPVADEIRGVVDGHWVLQRALAERGHFPAIDVLSSVSRVANRVTTEEHREAAALLRRLMTTLREQRDAIDLGLYMYGTHAHIDMAIDLDERITAFLRQAPHELSDLDTTALALSDIARSAHVR